MNLYVTEIKAIDPLDGELKTFGGPNVPGISQQDAQSYCQKNGLGYCKIIGLLVAEIPCKMDSYEPEFGGMVDYEKTRLN